MGWNHGKCQDNKAKQSHLAESLDRSIGEQHSTQETSGVSDERLYSIVCSWRKCRSRRVLVLLPNSDGLDFGFYLMPYDF